MSKPITAYKAFDENLQCRGFQYELGKTYEHEGEVRICDSGFHSCTNPLDCLNYYDITSSRFAEVELSGETETHSDDSKIASAEIRIKAELKLPEFVKRSVDYLLSLTDSDNESVQAASGEFAKLAASGDSAKLAASGYYAQLAASGDSAQLAASGEFAQLAASGDYAKLAASGDNAQLAASGYNAQLAASGEGSVIASCSLRSKAKGALGTWIALAEFDGEGKCFGFATGCVGKDGLKADTWYSARNGKLEEA